MKYVWLALVLVGCGSAPVSRVLSLTDDSYTGKKYYLGFGQKSAGGSEMNNEVKYDVQHTHDIFTKQIGGSYSGVKVLTDRTSDVQAEWNRIGGLLKSDDMYVQYSSGHGSYDGLAIGGSYASIRDTVLAYPAREMVVFMMACYAGNIVSKFDEKKSVWQNWGQQGRTLFVMGSSKPSESSATGPQTDPDEPGGPAGSAGSAYGHALWKALIGYADGYVDGVKDGYLSLDEIRDFTTWKTKQVGGHTPVTTGVYNPQLVMNRVPTAREIEYLESLTEE